MYTIQLNEKGSRTLNVSDENLRTIRKYDLFSGLIDSHGYITDSVLDKLRLNVRSLIASHNGDCKDLLDLCIDVIYDKNMKAFGLHSLILLYLEWQNNQARHTEDELPSEYF